MAALGADVTAAEDTADDETIKCLQVMMELATVQAQITRMLERLTTRLADLASASPSRRPVAAAP